MMDDERSKNKTNDARNNVFFFLTCTSSSDCCQLMITPPMIHEDLTLLDPPPICLSLPTPLSDRHRTDQSCTRATRTTFPSVFLQLHIPSIRLLYFYIMYLPSHGI